VPATATFRVVATGLPFPEGPVELPNGDIAVVGAGGINRIRLRDGLVTRLAECGGSPNGLALDRDGTILVANNGGVGRPDKVSGTLQRVTPEGDVTLLAGDLDTPNDVCVGADGAVFFTDPRDNWFAPEDERRPGRVWRWSGGALGLELVHEGLQYPNGIGFDRAGRLIVAESRTGRLHVVSDGASEVWATCPRGAPDGFCFDAEGTCFVACFDIGTLFVFDRDGNVQDELWAGPDTWTTNCMIASDGALMVTESRQGRLLAFDLGLRAA
jgi:gluconolactonase